jgi:hypothetical protein
VQEVDGCGGWPSYVMKISAMLGDDCLVITGTYGRSGLGLLGIRDDLGWEDSQLKVARIYAAPRLCLSPLSLSLQVNIFIMKLTVFILTRAQRAHVLARVGRNVRQPKATEVVRSDFASAL